MVVATIRTVAAILTVALLVLICGPIALLWTAVSGRANLMYSLGGGGVRLGFALAGIRLRVRGAEHLSLHGASTPAITAATSIRRRVPRARSSVPARAVLYKAELRRLPMLVWAFDIAGFVPLERANPVRAGRPSSARRRPPGGQIVPHFSGGHTQPHGRSAAVQEGRLCDGHQGAGADRAGRALRRPARDAKGSPLIWPAMITVEFSAPPVTTTGAPPRTATRSCGGDGRLSAGRNACSSVANSANQESR